MRTVEADALPLTFEIHNWHLCRQCDHDHHKNEEPSDTICPRSWIQNVNKLLELCAIVPLLTMDEPTRAVINVNVSLEWYPKRTQNNHIYFYNANIHSRVTSPNFKKLCAESNLYICSLQKQITSSFSIPPASMPEEGIYANNEYGSFDDNLIVHHTCTLLVSNSPRPCLFFTQASDPNKSCCSNGPSPLSVNCPYPDRICLRRCHLGSTVCPCFHPLCDSFDPAVPCYSLSQYSVGSTLPDVDFFQF